MDKKKWQQRFRNFIIPEFSRRQLIRLAVIGGAAVAFFALFKPCFISGSSMEPSWGDRTFTLSFRGRYWFALPKRGDVVTVSYFGREELLKRVVALPGDTVEFRNGILWLNGEMLQENYVKNPCRWNSEPLTVRDGFCFVVGDNRSQEQADHLFGEVRLKNISGGVLF